MKKYKEIKKYKFNEESEPVPKWGGVEIESLEESTGGTKVYKALGTIIKDIDKFDMSELSTQEKTSIKSRLDEIKNSLKGK